MRITPKSSAGFMLAGGSLALLAASLLPIWPMWHHGSWESTCEQATLWSLGLRLLIQAVVNPGAGSVTCSGDIVDQIMVGVFFVGGAVLGRVVYYLRELPRRLE
jgi:hypothetical protein